MRESGCAREGRKEEERGEIGLWRESSAARHSTVVTLNFSWNYTVPLAPSRVFFLPLPSPDAIRLMKADKATIDSAISAALDRTSVSERTR